MNERLGTSHHSRESSAKQHEGKRSDLEIRFSRTLMRVASCKVCWVKAHVVAVMSISIHKLKTET